MRLNIYNKSRGFTLVELIVVITILAVLGTIAFVSFQDYVGNSRDSKRTTDIKNIEKALELSKLQTGVYPNAGASKNITFSGATAWKQGEFNNDVVRVVRNFREAPKDPLVDSFYAYSVTKNQGEYQLGGVLEDTDYGTSANGKLAGAYVKGNYNGKIVKVSTGSTTYVLAAPSILTSDLNETDLLDIIRAKKLVYKGYQNLPASYTGTVYDLDGGFDFSPTSIVVYQGDLASVDNITLVDNLQTIYTGSVIADEPDIEVIFSEDKDLAADIVLGKKPGTSSTSTPSGSLSSDCPLNPDLESDFIFDSTTQTITGYNGDWGEVVIPCQIGGKDVLAIGTGAFEQDPGWSFNTPTSILTIFSMMEEGEGGEPPLPPEEGGEEGGAEVVFTKVHSLKLPGTVKSIGEKAFSYNEIQTLALPDSIESIGSRAFYYSELTTLDLGKGVKIIGDKAFQGNRIRNITFPSSLKSIGNDSFRQNPMSLDTLVFNEGLEVIGNYAFYDLSIPKLNLPDSLKSIGSSAFAWGDIGEVHLGSGIETIGRSAFSNSKINKINLPNGLKTIDSNGLKGNNLTNIQIPDSVTTFGSSVLSGNDLSIIHIPSTWTKIPSNMFAYNQGATTVHIPEGITVIGSMAFAGSKISTLTLPSTLETIESRAFENNELTNIIIPDTTKTIEKNSFNNNNLSTVKLGTGVQTIGDWAFANNNLTRIVIPRSTTSVGVSAFGYNNLVKSNTFVGCPMPAFGTAAFQKNGINKMDYFSIYICTNSLPAQ